MKKLCTLSFILAIAVVVLLSGCAVKPYCSDGGFYYSRTTGPQCAPYYHGKLIRN